MPPPSHKHGSGSKGKHKNSDPQGKNKFSLGLNESARSTYRSFIHDTLPPCLAFRTRSSVDGLKNPIDSPKTPYKYKPPFRRNFRYFGYPQNLNLDLNTPPRVRSWGPIEEQTAPVKPKRTPFRVGPGDEHFDPYWTGRLMKSSLLLENPGLLPMMDRAVTNLGKNRVQLVHPDFEHTNCPSELYFPLSPKSRKAFCRINKIAQEIIEKDIRNYTVQNPTLLKNKKLEVEVRKSEIERKSKQSTLAETTARKSYFSITDFYLKTADELFYDNRKIPPIMKTFCIDNKYPGMNVQLYEKPRDVESGEVEEVVKEDDRPVTGIARVPHHKLNIPDDIWAKLAKVRVRRHHLAKIRKNIKNKNLRTFTQLELRNQVMQDTRRDFVAKLKHDVDSPLPSELYVDNRDIVEPPHDYLGKDELPPQGPFWWKVLPETSPSPEELKIVEKYIEGQKDHHHFTHHLPGLLYMPRHPFQQFELDWMEPGAEMTGIRDARKTPAFWQDIPGYLMEMDSECFDEKFTKAVTEGAKDLIGPEIYELYRKQKRLKSPVVSEHVSTEEIPKENVPAVETPKKKIIKQISKAKPQPKKVSQTAGENEDEEEADEFEDEEEEEDPYRLEADLDEEELFPLPDVHFSLVEFPKDGIPPGLKDELKFFKKEVEQATPVQNNQEEDTEGESGSETTSSEEEELDQPGFSHNPVSHLQVMYQDAVKTRYKSAHRVIKNPAELEPPDLKNIFLIDDYTEDIEQLLNHNENIPKFLQLF